MPGKFRMLFLFLLLLASNIQCRIYAGAETEDSVWSAMGPGSQLNICRELLWTAGWREALDSPDSIYSLIAPNNDAFIKLGEGRLEELNEPAHLDELKTILARHIYTGFLGHDELSASGKTRFSIGGQTYPVTKVGSKWFIGKALVVKDAIIARNGIVYVVDTVLE